MKTNSGEDGHQGSLQEDTNMTARRGKKELLTCKSYFPFYSEVNLVLYEKSLYKYVTVSATVLAKVTFPSEQQFQIIFILLVSTLGQADLLPRATTKLSTPLILTAPSPVLPQEEEGGPNSQPWEKLTSKHSNQREPCYCQEGTATNHTPLPLTCNHLKAPEKEEPSPSYCVQQDISY